MVEKVDGALANISSDVGEVHTLLAEMATDNAAQSTAITQISTRDRIDGPGDPAGCRYGRETSAAARNLNTEVSALSEQAGRAGTALQARHRLVQCARRCALAPLAPRASKPT